jgi:3-oxoacyl-[acyl-carrier-protein] synthase-3
MGAPEDDVVQIRKIVENCLRSVLPVESGLPTYDEDWIESGLLDSMAHVEVLLCLEKAAHCPNAFNRIGSAPINTIRSAIEAIRNVASSAAEGQSQGTEREFIRTPGTDKRVGILGWGVALGTKQVSVDAVEHEFDLPNGSLKVKAGIESLCRVAENQDEVSLATGGARRALQMAGISQQSVDWIIGTSETFLCFPSLAASLHTALLATSTCRVLDVGGACVGLLNCFAVADALFADGRVNCILIVSPGRVDGEFGGLFGDAASAFVLRRQVGASDALPYSVAAGIAGCAGTFSSVLRIRLGVDGTIILNFEGDALAHAAIDRMDRVIRDLETISGKSRHEASAFAIHQPNPRLVDIFLRRMELPIEKVPVVARRYGNLGASTCGVALSMALDNHARKPRSERGPIFVVSVGPGMLWAGTVLE